MISLTFRKTWVPRPFLCGEREKRRTGCCCQQLVSCRFSARVPVEGSGRATTTPFPNWENVGKVQVGKSRRPGPQPWGREKWGGDGGDDG